MRKAGASRRKSPKKGAERPAPSALEERFRAVFEASRDAIGVSRDGAHRFVNPAYLALFGLAPGTDLADTPILDLIAPESRDQVREYAARRERGEPAPETYATLGRRVDGTPFDMEVSVSRYREGGEELTLAVLRDISERRRLERESAMRGATLRQIMDAASVAIFLVDRSGRITHANRRMAEMFGRPLEDLLGSEYVDLVHPSERELGRGKMLALLASRIESVDLERHYWRPDGTEFWGHLSGRRFHDVEGNEVGLIGVIADVDTRRRAEAGLRESEEQYRQLFEAESDAIVLIENATGRILKANDAACAMYGRSREELLAMTNADLSAEPAETRRVTTDTPIDPGTPVRIPFRLHRRSDGTVFPVEITGRFFNHRGRPVHIAAIRDITERAKAEKALRESEERFRTLADAMPLTVFEMDPQGRFTYLNRAALETFGYSRERLEAGMSLADVLLPEDLVRARAAMARRLAGEAVGYREYRARRSDGSTFPVTVASSPILRDGEPAGFRGIVVDLTERRELEEERLKIQKLESLGTLAGGIAHDFNNLLQGVFGSISTAREDLEPGSRPRVQLERAELALRQAVGLTSQLLTFSQGGRPVKKALALRPVLESAVGLALSGSPVGAELAIEEGLDAVEADEGQLGQVFQNIVLNAAQAMPAGGGIRITARNVPEPALPAFPGMPRGPAVEVRITDAGGGIPPEHLSRIFDPYFTTKERGSGLGLASAHAIVRNHGGAITVSSEPGRGATFSVYLPSSAALVEPPAKPPARRGCRTARILVMDDEAIVRDVLRDSLSALGHDAVLAASGEEALERHREACEAKRPFDLVILDLTVRGGMGGVETLRALRERDPAVVAVVSSGYSEGGALSDHRALGFSAFLKKPFLMSDLRNALEALLA